MTRTDMHAMQELLHDLSENPYSFVADIASRLNASPTRITSFLRHAKKKGLVSNYTKRDEKSRELNVWFLCKRNTTTCAALIMNTQHIETLQGLMFIGGMGNRVEIAAACGLTVRSVSNALSFLKQSDYVGNIDAGWHITDAGIEALSTTEKQKMIDEHGEEIMAELEVNKTEIKQEIKTGQQTVSVQEKMQGELKAYKNNKFLSADAAWLCRALSGEMQDMPTVASLLGQMADYWEAMK